MIGTSSKGIQKDRGPEEKGSGPKKNKRFGQNLTPSGILEKSHTSIGEAAGSLLANSLAHCLHHRSRVAHLAQVAAVGARRRILFLAAACPRAAQGDSKRAVHSGWFQYHLGAGSARSAPVTAFPRLEDVAANPPAGRSASPACTHRCDLRHTVPAYTRSRRAGPPSWPPAGRQRPADRREGPDGGVDPDRGDMPQVLGRLARCSFLLCGRGSVAGLRGAAVQQ